MSRDDEITLNEIDCSFFRDRLPPSRWSHHLLALSIAQGRKRFKSWRWTLAHWLMRWAQALMGKVR